MNVESAARECRAESCFAPSETAMVIRGLRSGNQSEHDRVARLRIVEFGRGIVLYTGDRPTASVTDWTFDPWPHSGFLRQNEHARHPHLRRNSVSTG